MSGSEEGNGKVKTVSVLPQKSAIGLLDPENFKAPNLDQFDDFGRWLKSWKNKCAQALYKKEYINSKAV